MRGAGWSLVLGGTRGLGAEIARAARDRGWRTIEVGRSASGSVEPDRQTVRCDLAAPEDVASLVRRLDAERVDVDRFFWVAGAMGRGAFAEQDPAEVVRLVDVNLRNALLVAQWAWRHLQDRGGGGTFTVVASTAAGAARPKEAVYSATKAAQAAFARSLAAENVDERVGVSLFLPGGMKTSLWSADPHPEFDSFLEPGAVAEWIVGLIERQREPFVERLISRGSL